MQAPSGQEASPLLIEAIALLEGAGRPADQKRAQYWLAYVHMALDDPEESRRLLLQLVGADPALVEDPDFEVRVRIALARSRRSTATRRAARCTSRRRAGSRRGLDLRKRGVYFDALSKARFEANDTEGAIRAATEALALFRASEQEVQEAPLENALAMSFVRLGNLGARRRARGPGPWRSRSACTTTRPLGHYLDTQATIRLARGEYDEAIRLVDRALALEAEHGPRERPGRRPDHARAGPDAAGPRGRGRGRLGRGRRGGLDSLASPMRRQAVFAAWAESLAAQGRHADAYEVMRQALCHAAAAPRPLAGDASGGTMSPTHGRLSPMKQSVSDQPAGGT